METGTIAVTIDISEDKVCDLLVTACEESSGYWARTKRYPYITNWDTLQSTLRLPVTVWEVGDDGKLGDRHRLDMDAIKRGLQLLATTHPSHFADLINDNADAETADVFLQLAVLGEVRYG